MLLFVTSIRSFLVSIVYSFAARLYGQRRAKRKTEAIVEQLQEADD